MALLALPGLLPPAVEEIGDVGVLLGLGHVQLPPAALGYHLGQRGLGLQRRKGDRIGPAIPVPGHRRHVERGRAAAIEFLEVQLPQGHRQLAGPVGPEVDEDDRLVGGDAAVVADHGGLDELVGLVPLVGLPTADTSSARGARACTIAS